MVHMPHIFNIRGRHSFTLSSQHNDAAAAPVSADVSHTRAFPPPNIIAPTLAAILRAQIPILFSFHFFFGRASFFGQSHNNAAAATCCGYQEYPLSAQCSLREMSDQQIPQQVAAAE